MNMEKTTNSPLPPLYACWFDDLLAGAIPVETRATCNDCAMCDKGAANVKEELTAGFFRPDIKCCSYHPTVMR